MLKSLHFFFNHRNSFEALFIYFFFKQGHDIGALGLSGMVLETGEGWYGVCKSE